MYDANSISAPPRSVRCLIPTTAIVYRRVQDFEKPGKILSNRAKIFGPLREVRLQAPLPVVAHNQKVVVGSVCCWRGARKLYKARSPLYRSQSLQPNIRWKRLAEIYTIHAFAPLSNLQFFVKSLLEFCQKLLNFPEFYKILPNTAEF